MKNNSSYKHSNKSRKRNKKINRWIRVTIIVFIAVILSTVVLKSVDTMSLGTNKDTTVDNKDNVNVIRDDQKELAENNITTNESDNVDNTSGNEEKLEDNQIVYLPLEADNNATDAREVQSRLTEWNYQREDNEKVAYLTFDDGPSEYVTDEILDVLKEKDVKATFFVLGSMVDKNDYAKKALKRIVKEGHAIGNHGYCHRYDVLYPGNVVNVDSFMADMKKSEDAMKELGL